jgi:hypothetical protein
LGGGPALLARNPAAAVSQSGSGSEPPSRAGAWCLVETWRTSPPTLESRVRPPMKQPSDERRAGPERANLKGPTLAPQALPRKSGAPLGQVRATTEKSGPVGRRMCRMVKLSSRPPPPRSSGRDLLTDFVAERQLRPPPRSVLLMKKNRLVGRTTGTPKASIEIRAGPRPPQHQPPQRGDQGLGVWGPPSSHWTGSKRRCAASTPPT